VFIYFAKFLTAAVVVAGVVLLSPAIILHGEMKTHDLNAKGETSQVAWTSADTGAGSGPYVVLAACTLRLSAEYDHAAFALVKLNLALKSAAAALVCGAKTALFKQELLALFERLVALVSS
jgi:hypothetical protein